MTENDTSTTLDLCILQCDDNFSYIITVEYSDLLEVARLECRDGCQMALMRCQPDITAFKYYLMPMPILTLVFYIISIRE